MKDDNVIKISLRGQSQAKYLNSAAKRSSIIIRRKKLHGKNAEAESILDYIRIGSCFRRIRKDKAVEEVNVTGLSADSFGIPHIRYDMRSRNPYATSAQYDGSKMLSLPAFIDIFTKRIAPSLRK